MENKTKKVILKGEAYWARITGNGAKNYNEDGREFQISLVIDKNSDAAKDFVGTVTNMATEAFGKHDSTKINLPYNIWEEKENGVVTAVHEDKYIVRAKQNVYPIDKETKKQDSTKSIRELKVFDSTPKRIELGERLLGNGSIVNVSMNLVPWKVKASFGISAYINQIQIIKPEWYSGVDFEAEADAAGEGAWVDEDGSDNDFVEQKEDNVTLEV